MQEGVQPKNRKATAAKSAAFMEAKQPRGPGVQMPSGVPPALCCPFLLSRPHSKASSGPHASQRGRGRGHDRVFQKPGVLC